MISYGGKLLSNSGGEEKEKGNFFGRHDVICELDFGQNGLWSRPTAVNTKTREPGEVPFPSLFLTTLHYEFGPTTSSTTSRRGTFITNFSFRCTGFNSFRNQTLIFKIQDETTNPETKSTLENKIYNRRIRLLFYLPFNSGPSIITHKGNIHLICSEEKDGISVVPKLPEHVDGSSVENLLR